MYLSVVSICRGIGCDFCVSGPQLGSVVVERSGMREVPFPAASNKRR